MLGQLLAVAKDQNGCRFLQRKFDEGGASAVAVVFQEALQHLVPLMTDPFGNYLVQKLLDRCSEEQRLEVRPGERGFRGICLRVWGGRVIKSSGWRCGRGRGGSLRGWGVGFAGGWN